MAEPLVIVGAGGFGREVVQLVRAVNSSAQAPSWDLLGVVDDRPSDQNLDRLGTSGTSYLGTCDWFADASAQVRFVVAIGSPPIRRALVSRIEAEGCRAAVLVHPHATVGADVQLGEGTIVCAGARLTTNIRLGRHVHIDTNATVGHDTELGDYVRLNPASSVSGDCILEDEVLVGVAAAILNQVRVGHRATVGGSACVVRDVTAGDVVKGVPAK